MNLLYYFYIIKQSIMENQNDTINQFIINVALIEPITEILANINNGGYRDCDVKWLDAKIDAFAKFAAETLGFSSKLVVSVPRESFPYINNPYAKEYYTTIFSTLLGYFKTL